MIVGFFVVFFVLYQKRQKESLLKQAKLKEAFSVELMNTQIELKEEVFKQISQEIHDNVGQSLTFAKMQLNYIQSDGDKEKAVSAKELITRSLSDLRDLSKSLNGTYILNEGLENAIQRELNYIKRTGEMKCELRNGHFTFQLDEGVEIILFRCVQECLSNAVKYSQASEIIVTIEQIDDRLLFTIADNGVGLPEDWRENTGVGMVSLKKRVELLQGELNIDSKPQKGTKISINLPAINLEPTL